MHTPRLEESKRRLEESVSALELFHSSGRNSIRAIAPESHLQTLEWLPMTGDELTLTRSSDTSGIKWHP